MGSTNGSTAGRLSTALLSWYGSTGAAVAAAAGDPTTRGFNATLHQAVAAWHRWHDGRSLGPARRLAVAAKLAKRLFQSSVRREFTVKPLEPLVARRLQFLGRKIFRLVHHAPHPLQVPAAYLQTVLPADAPVIAIVTPSFNQGHVLEATLRSVLDLGYPDLEYVVQDGGSTNASVAILERYAPRLLAWESAPDGGQAPAINRGLRRTTGEIMAYLNSDDILLPGSLAYVASYFRSHPEVDVVYGHRVLIDGADAEIGRWVLPRHDDRACLRRLHPTGDDVLAAAGLGGGRRRHRRVVPVRDGLGRHSPLPRGGPDLPPATAVPRGVPRLAGPEERVVVAANGSPRDGAAHRPHARHHPES
ncbi:MAG: glycosyltransferase family 2 protein [Pirellulales bacterium]